MAGFLLLPSSDRSWRWAPPTAHPPHCRTPASQSRTTPSCPERGKTVSFPARRPLPMAARGYGVASSLRRCLGRFRRCHCMAGSRPLPQGMTHAPARPHRSPSLGHSRASVHSGHRARPQAATRNASPTAPHSSCSRKAPRMEDARCPAASFQTRKRFQIETARSWLETPPRYRHSMTGRANERLHESRHSMILLQR